MSNRQFSHARLLRLVLLAGSASVVLASPAQAQDTPTQSTASEGRTIIVTATKRNSTVQDVPFSINAQTAEDI